MQDIIRDVVVQASVDLFDAYGIQLAHEPDRDPNELGELVLSGIIGFTGEDLRGTLVWAGNQQLLDFESFQGATPRDWVAELANQLLGRIKNRMLDYGVTLYLSTPLTMRGHHLRPEPSHEGVEPYRLFGEGPAAVVWFDVEARDDLELVLKEDAESSHAEGEMLLF